MIPDAPNWFFSTCAFIGFVQCMIPLPWHLESWNTGTCLYMVWTGLACLNSFINSVVWNSDVINRAPVWCDISSHFMVATTFAIPAASLCINRRLYYIASVSTVTRTRAEKRRDVLVDLAIGVGLPIIGTALHIVVQTQRFIIFEEVGCFPFTFNTAPAYPLYIAWPLILGVISATYCVRTIRELAIRRAQFKEFLATNRNLSSSRYFRLMGLASLEIFLTIPLASYSIYLDVSTNSVQPYVSWKAAHAMMSTVVQVPSVAWRATQLSTVSLELTRWYLIIYAVAFFAFFGFADEARKNYRLAYVSVAKRVGLSTGSMTATGTWSADGTNPDMSYKAQSSMPVFITHQTEKKRDSLASFTSQLSLQDYGGALGDVKKVAFSPTATTSGSISKESLPRSPVDLDAIPLPTLPEASLDTNAPPRYAHDTSNAV